jgi:hypothetical protein
MSAELSIILLNVVIILIAYAWAYPKLAGKNINKVAAIDGVMSGLALVIVANKYWEQGVTFDFLQFELNWFWFTLVTYTIIEIPIVLWYFKLGLSKGKQR